MPTESIENYLKTIFLLEESSGEERVSTKQIANALGFSQASVSGMLQALADEDFVCYEKYHGVRLSDKGRRQALSVLRKHRLVEMLLVELFHYQWDEVHEEAEFLEHAISDRLAQRIDEFLGFPEYDPHGDPIPSRDGILPDRNLVPLATLSPGDVATLGRVMTNDKAFLQYLHSRHLDIGVTVRVNSVQPIDGQMELLVENHAVITLSHLIISKLFMVLS